MTTINYDPLESRQKMVTKQNNQYETSVFTDIKETVIEAKNTIDQKTAQAKAKTNDVIDNINETASNVSNGIKNNANQKIAQLKANVNNFVDNTNKTVNSFSIDFQDHEVSLKGHSYDYTTLSTSLGIATKGYTTAYENGFSAMQDLWSAGKSLLLSQPVDAVKHFSDAVIHAGTAGALAYAHNHVSVMRDSLVAVAPSLTFAIDAVFESPKFIGVGLGLVGASDLYSQYHDQH